MDAEVSEVSKRAKKKERASRRRRRVAVGGVAAIGASMASMFVVASPAAAACAGGYMIPHTNSSSSDGSRTYWWGYNQAKAPASGGCSDTNVEYSTDVGTMRGRYYSSSAGAWYWGSSTVPIVTAGDQSPWKVIISDLSDGTVFNHGHTQLLSGTRWRY